MVKKITEISRWSPEKIIQIYETNNRNFQQCAEVAGCSRTTFSRYYRKSIIDRNSMINRNSMITKSTNVEDFLDPLKFRVAVLDIESTSLNGDFGVILCVVIKTYGTNETKLFYVDLSSEELLDSEKQMIAQVNEYLRTFDGVITYYGNKFDLPMIRTRSYYHGIDPIPKIKSLDVYFTAKRVMKTSSRRLERVSDLMRIHCNKDMPEKTGVAINEWITVVTDRNVDALAYICDHCIRDVEILEDVTNELRPFLPDRIVRA